LPFVLRWSPGRPDLLRFTITGPLYSVWECSADGSGMHRFPPARPWAETARGALGAGWTPDGKYYLFQSRDEHGTGFWAVREARDVVHPFDPRPFAIYTTATDAGVLVPSTDGKKLFFAQSHDTRDLVSYDAKRNQFLPFFGGSPVRGVAFSNDGQWVAYEEIPEGVLWCSRADGSKRLQLTSPPMRISEPHWSMDGRHIAFTGTLKNDDDDARVYVVRPDGGSVEPIPLGAFHSSSPSWSGDSLMSNCWRAGARAETLAVCVMDWKTGKTSVVPGTRELLRPAWSPDGRYVAALRESGTQVVLFDMHSHEWAPLADHANYGIPFWTRDGHFFYFQEVLGGTDQPIFRVNVATRAVEQTMSSRQIPQSGFSGYMLTGLTPGDAPIATVLRRNGDLFALEVDLP
jgi:Tol biopolymer transport system component